MVKLSLTDRHHLPRRPQHTRHRQAGVGVAEAESEPEQGGASAAAASSRRPSIASISAGYNYGHALVDLRPYLPVRGSSAMVEERIYKSVSEKMVLQKTPQVMVQ